MNTTTCKFCNWEQPVRHGTTGRCVVCGGQLEHIVCSKCGEVIRRSDTYRNNAHCKKCHAKMTTAAIYARRQSLRDKSDAWIAKVQRVPANYPTLTEEQWLAACKFFDGCARCHSKDIDSRGFFVGAKLGGRYCNWNIIPLCEKCAVNWDLERQTFYYTENRDRHNRSDEFRTCLAKIVEYLEPKLDAAIDNT